MRRLLDNVGHIALYFGAASFWAVGGTVVILSVVGVVPGSDWLDAGNVLRGASITIEEPRLRELETAERKLEELRKRNAADPTYAYLREALASMEEERERREAAISNERARLAAWQNELAGLQNAINSDIETLEQKRAELSAEVEAATTSVVSEAEQRVFNIYRQMEAAQVAADLQSRFAAGDTAGAAEILNRLPERQAASILAEINDPRMRVGLLQEMRTFAADRLADMAPGTGKDVTEGAGR